MADSAGVEEGPWDPLLHESKHSFVWEAASGLVELLAPQPKERVLDLGCGTGQLTAQIADAGAEVVGLDSAAAMIERARANYPALRLEVGDARNFHFDEPFDAVFSNAVLHWVPEAERVVACVWEALKPSGRFVAEFGGKGNVKKIVAALRKALVDIGALERAEENPWYYPSVAQYSAVLERQGFSVTYAHLFPRPTPLEGGDKGLRSWINMFDGGFLAGLSEQEVKEVVGSVEKQLHAHLYRHGRWVADYRRLRIVALREPDRQGE